MLHQSRPSIRSFVNTSALWCGACGAITNHPEILHAQQRMECDAMTVMSNWECHQSVWRSA
jgi:hypothetical protein